MEEFVTEDLCAERNRDKDGRFYFWRNSFLAVIAIIFGGIASCYLYVNARTELSNEKISASDKTIAVMQRDIDYIRQSVDEQKATQREILRELRK